MVSLKILCVARFVDRVEVVDCALGFFFGCVFCVGDIVWSRDDACWEGVEEFTE